MAKRNLGADAIERRLLDLAYTTEIKITAPALAYFAPCTIAEAAEVLDDLAAHDRVRMTVEDDGTVVYDVPARQKLGPTPAAPATPHVAPAAPRRVELARSVSPLIAALLTVAVPGAGHLISGRILAGLGWFLLVSIGYALILPGVLFHVLAIVSAARSAARALPAARRPLLAAA